ncbi:hypothetical protein A3A03_01700 [Candidatus Nomurabacteria bacterium RIFCSPLOWO2_01_FULL_40_18]|uniref:Membrane protein 6-pyruvoyl-tetrahydropterin synthase-related domain-containing protein n=1 Tax=Candidatus Nomurabacteria bacterium RIFCSPLOWO2_01_FULL_40_18 TaxID=1801773 RepID=A0A1F6XHZ7_9BACT|nr:MAG: hypothetical protein A3A03_01700 [Candidatus Nomurabacteria bacterium RIFCSPLOWO2_01_FULL_40_18]
MKNNHFKNPYILGGLVIIFIAGLIVFFFQQSFLTIDGDLTYHLATSQSFVREGGVTLWENWDSLPLGRPHLYPPLVHLLLAVPVYLGIAFLTTIKLFSGLGIIFGLLLSWFGVTKLFGARAGFFYLGLVTSFVIFIKLLGVTVPASLVLMLSPFLIVLTKRDNILPPILLLTLLLYTHMIFPWLVIGAFFIWALCNRQYFQKTLRIILVAVCLYLPWLIHIASNLEYLRYFGPNYGQNIAVTATYTTNLSIFFLFVVSLSILFNDWKKNIINTDISYFLALVIVSLPIAYFEYSRYWYSIGIWPMMVVIIYTLARIPRRRPSSIIFSTLFILTLIISFNVKIQAGEFSFSRTHHLLLEASLPQSPNYIGNYTSAHFNQANLEIADYIRKNTPSDAVIQSYAHLLDKEEYFDHRLYILPQLFVALSDRVMGNLRSPEMNWQEGIEIEQAGIVLLNTDQLDDFKNTNFQLVFKTKEGLAVLINNHPAPLTLPDAQVVMPLYLAWSLLALVFGYLAYHIRRSIISSI